MFIEIKIQDGVKASYGLKGYPYDKNFLINLNLIPTISIYKDEIFFEGIDYHNNSITVNFTKNGIGEYQRIKRIIESQILK